MIRATVSNEKEVTIDFVVAESRKMWVKVREAIKAKKLPLGDTDAANEMIARMHKEHREFCVSYPVVMRYMVEMQQYHSGAFEKYLRKIAIHPWRDEDGFLESQADYVTFLYRETHPRWTIREVATLRANILETLRTEHREIKELGERITAEVEEKEARLMNRSRASLREWLRQQRSLGETAGDTSDTITEVSALAETAAVEETIVAAAMSQV